VVTFSPTPPGTQTFEAADVHVSAPGTSESGGFLPNGRLEFRAYTLFRLITTAYDLPPDRIFGGPSWLDTDRFDLIAQAAPSTPPAALRPMLQSLLTERFHLSVRRENKPQPVYVLTLGKGARTESPGTGDPDCKFGVEENVRTYTCHHTSLASLAARLNNFGFDYFDRPVIDRTGLKGSFDFKLRWLQRWQLPAGAEGASLSLIHSVEKELGVKVEEDAVPLPALTVERASRTPVDNPPGVIEKLGATPTEFEVANIRPTPPEEKPNRVMMNGRFEVQAMALRDMIAFAYNVEPDWVRGGEKWLETDLFDITAKSVPTASSDTRRRMLQSLLAERFHLKIHREDQPVPVFALTAGKPKLKPADPETRSGCTLATTGVRTLTCRNATISRLADQLRTAAPNYINHTVVDLTGIEGAYDFEFSWGNARVLLGTAERGPNESAASGSGIPVASDRPVGLTIFEAVDRQFGLKLAPQKHPMPVVVIDHMDRTPTEN
jgi:uncharacterized protein (TIGR03435 family)